MFKYVIYFFEVASWKTILIMVPSLLALLICITELFLKKKIIRNVVGIVVLFFCLSSGLKFFASDIEDYDQRKDIENQIGSKLGVNITKSEVINSEVAGDAHDYNIKLFATKLPSGKACEMRTVRIKERYVGGMWGTLRKIEGLSLPTDCDSRVFQTIPQNAEENLAPPTAKLAVAQPQSAPVGDLLFRTANLSPSYSLYRLSGDQVSILSTLFNTKLPLTMDHYGTEFSSPVSKSFKNVQIVSTQKSAIDNETALVINGVTILKRDDAGEEAPFESIGELLGETEAILVGTYSGGNSCDTQQQAVVVHTSSGYSITKGFGRCHPSIYQDQVNGRVYFVYAANEYHTMEVLALVKAQN